MFWYNTGNQEKKIQAFIQKTMHQMLLKIETLN